MVSLKIAYKDKVQNGRGNRTNNRQSRNSRRGRNSVRQNIDSTDDEEEENLVR